MKEIWITGETIPALARRARILKRLRVSAIWILFGALVAFVYAGVTAGPEQPDGTRQLSVAGSLAVLVGVLLVGLSVALFVMADRLRLPTQKRVEATKHRLKKLSQELQGATRVLDGFLTEIEQVERLSQKLRAEELALRSANEGTRVKARDLARLSGSRSFLYDGSLVVLGALLGWVVNWLATLLVV
jgi:protein-S-isoprenylcysteine O-methyltransferase Ste14